MSVQTFKRMVLENTEHGMTELASKAVTQHHLSHSEAMGLLRAWRKDGTVKAIKAAAAGPGKPRTILTAP